MYESEEITGLFSRLPWDEEAAFELIDLGDSAHPLLIDHGCQEKLSLSMLELARLEGKCVGGQLLRLLFQSCFLSFNINVRIVSDNFNVVRQLSIGVAGNEMIIHI
jgi:hypothetical protein